MNRLIITALTSSLFAGCVATVDSTSPEPDPQPGSGSGSTGDIASHGTPGQPWRILDVAYEVQTTPYWCGPTATKIALSAHIAPPGQSSLAGQLGTTTNGTDWIGQVTGVLNANLHAGWYVTRELPSDPPSQAERDLLWSDLVRGVDDGFPLVANIVAPPSNHPPGYPSDRTIYHYFTVDGYNPDTREAHIADPANFGGHQRYWIPFAQLATLIPPKGYTALAACARDAVVGKIAEKFDALGGCGSLVGPPITGERGTPDGVGRYSVFERGSIYWTPQLGAHEVHGRIRDAWAAAGWETGSLGYPTSDEYADGDGRRSDFQHGFIHWSAATDATTIGSL